MFNTRSNYMIFAGHQFYPNGGFNDIKAALSYFDKKRIIDFIENSSSEYDWCHVIDTQALQIILKGKIDDDVNRKWEWKDVEIV